MVTKIPPGLPICSEFELSLDDSSIDTKDINNEVVTAKPTVQAKLQEAIDAGIKLNYESVVHLINSHPWEDSKEPFENGGEYDYVNDDYSSYNDEEYDETMDMKEKNAESI